MFGLFGSELSRIPGKYGWQTSAISPEAERCPVAEWQAGVTL